MSGGKAERRDAPVAIVGIGCRFPGGVTDAAGFWKLLSEGGDAITEIPRDRIDIGHYFDPRPATPGRIMTRWGGFLDRIDEFDAMFFGISPREASSLDPQQRLALETAWEALEDAGQDAAALEGSDTGVFVGQWLSDFEGRLFADPEGVEFQMTTGSGRYATSGRISYCLGLRGPSLTLDTACSSSLAAVHLAASAVRRGECGLALAGGTNVILQPHITVAYSQSRMMAPDGRCKFGDSRGDGYVRSEGAALVLLKPLDRAIADGDRIYAVIRGGAVNNDGRSSGSMGTPSRLGQEELLRRAYRDAGVDPASVGYIEAHGTGTRAGDPVELGALGIVLGEGRPRGQRARVGSVKTNIGHTEGAAGVAGLVKAALALHHGHIPASLHCRELNPTIAWDDLPLEVAREASAWPRGTAPRVAGVSAFGIAGTNAHVVLEEAPVSPATSGSHASPRKTRLLALSARGPEALRALAGRHAAAVESMDEAALDTLCWNAARRRTALSHRAAFVARDARTLAEALRRYAEGEGAEPVEVPREAPAARACMIVPGQGAQWLGMARELMAEEPVFREALDRCDRAMRPWADWSIVQQLAAAPGDGKYRLDQIDVIQPVLVAIAIAYAELWRSMGVEPAAVVGHSMGEVGAACVAGVLDIDQAMRIICRRSALMRRTSGQGAMALVELSMDEARARLRGREAEISVAVSNSPRSSVISGDPKAVQVVMAELERDGVFCRLVKVDVASHSPQMEPLAQELKAELADLRPHAGRIPIFSTVLARRADGTELDAGYWARNLRQPVMFGDTVAAIVAEGITAFIELGPHPVLLPSVEQTAKARGAAVATIACGRREEAEQANFLAAAGAAWCAGVAIDWARLMPGRAPSMSLPLYPWQRERHWSDAAAQTSGAALADPSRSGANPLLERRFEAAGESSVSWETTLNPSRFGWLADHVVRDTAIVPGAAYCEAALAAAAESRGGERWAIVDVEFLAAWAIAPGTAPRLQVRLDWMSATRARFEVHGEAAGEGGGWQRCATGLVVPAQDAAPPLPAIEGASDALSGDEVYGLLSEVGLAYGPAFRGVREMKLSGSEAMASIQLDAATLDPRATRHVAFPPLLDAVLQALATAIVASDADDPATPIPTRVGRIELLRPMPADAALTVRLSAARGDADVLDAASGERIAAIRGLAFERMRQSGHAGPDSLLHRAEWVEAEPIKATAEPAPVVVVARSSATAEPLLRALAASKANAVHVASPDAVEGALAALSRGVRAQVVHLGALEGAEATDGAEWIEDAWTRAGDETLALARALESQDAPPRVWLVTRRAQSTGTGDGATAPGAAMLWGLGRVWAHERPALDVTLVDIESSVADLAPLLRAEPAPRQLALRSGRCLRLRLAPWTDSEAPAAIAAPNVRVEIASPGEPDTLHWQAALRPAPAAHEVEVEVAHVGLNFMNLMSALGIYPGYENGRGPLGIECAGRVARVGSAVTHVKPGDEVVAVGHECLQRHARVHGELVARRPRALDSGIAAGMPIAFLTAIYSLVELARVERGDRVLIHSAAGGVGLAAIQVARRAGAEVLATAGTEEKRALLRSMGVAHVFDSRGDFADAVLAATQGKGVDVVLNSLAGEAIAAGLRCLAPYGRFVELGKRDIYGGARVDLAPFRASLAYFAVDLDRMMRERPERLGRILRELVRDIDAGAYQALPVTHFAADDLVAAFKNLMAGTHVGKHVVALEPLPREVRAAPGLRSPVRADGCYVVTGGLGALGLEVARWLARRGAGALMLVGRSEPSEAARTRIAEIESAGTRVLTAACDVADREALARVLERARREGGPLKGVFHAAGVLADATLGEMTPQGLRAPREAKVMGAWNLDRLTRGDALDAFAMFSSVAALFGTPGQGNYAAANAFLDALAHDRRARGLPGLAIALGPVSAVGLAAASAVRGSSLRRLGFEGITAASAIEALDRFLAAGVPHAACAAFDAGRWHAATARAGAIDFVPEAAKGEGARADGSGEPPLREALEAVPAGTPRRTLLENAIKAEAGAVLRIAPQRVPSDRALKGLGLDSLMALELRNRLEKRGAVSLSPTLAWNHPTVQALASHLADKMGVALDAPAAAPAAAPEVDALLAELAHMDADDALRLLADTEGR